ncbi:MAG: hypothetical protein V3V12_00175 [Gammaproteobacteria bacterium]
MKNQRRIVHNYLRPVFNGVCAVKRTEVYPWPYFDLPQLAGKTSLNPRVIFPCPCAQVLA